MQSSKRKEITVTHYINLLKKYLGPQLPKVILTALLLLSSIALQLIGPQVLRTFIDTTQSGGSAGQIGSIALLFLGVVLSTQFVTGLAAYFSEDVGWVATNALRSDLTLHCLSLDLSFHKAHSPGEMIERVDGDVEMLSDFFSQFIVRVLGYGLVLLGILILVCLVDVRIGLVVLAYVVVTALLLRRMQGIAVPFLKKTRQATAELSGFWGDYLKGREDIAASNAATYVMRRYFQLQHKLNAMNIKSQLMTQALEAVWRIVTSITIASVLTLGAYFFTQGSMTIGTIFLIFTYMTQFSDNFSEISNQINTLQQAMASFERIAELYYQPSLIQDGPGIQLPPGALEVDFDHVSFSYIEEKPVFSDISFKLLPGEILGLLGRTGVGKTTLVRLLLRFYDPTGGTILLGGQDIRLARLKELRENIGFVTQEVQLFQATVRDNLTFFDKAIPDTQLFQAIDQLGLHDWFARLPQGLDTRLASGGSLSAGEAQLLAFTRVFLKDPKLIIFDEASSRLDLASERLLAQTIKKLLVGRTGIMIAHRLSTLEQVDTIMILENGGIAEFGKRDALMRDASSLYASLLRASNMEEILS
ncbi:MAG TPA: ABC transporter ATP-binding protein [Ktedonobacteraceae bacterium]|nr:ABC transporter ATP-binding protein [Ktedonobacteraceae bacterium]